MFSRATNFNQPLNVWNVASVNNMFGMFSIATTFNVPLDDWNVASVTNMAYMFTDASNFNQCLSSWAEKIPPDVNVGVRVGLFSSSGCPNKSAAANVAPWCQGDAEQCIAPSKS